MNTPSKFTSHPLQIIAAVALILFCAVGIAAFMDWLPKSNSSALSAEQIAQQEKKLANDSKVAATPAKKTSTSHHVVARAPSAKPVAATASCYNCGVVESSSAIRTNGEGSGLGAVGGAVVGGLLGNQVGGGRGKDAMTVVGAVGGAVAGNHIEKRAKATTQYETVVRMNDGSSRVITETGPSVWRSGDRVIIVDGRLRAN